MRSTPSDHSESINQSEHTYANISQRAYQDSQETAKLKEEISSLRSDLLSHNKLFRAMYERLKSLEGGEFDQVAETIKEKLPDPPLNVYKSVHPPASIERTTEEGTDIYRPSMNDANFESGYDPNWDKNNDY